MDMHKIAFIGDEQTGLPFTALGIDIFTATEKDVIEQFKSVTNSAQFNIIFITEPLYKTLEYEIKKISQKSLPVVVLLPTLSGSQGIALEILRETMKKAAGVDLMNNE